MNDAPAAVTADLASVDEDLGADSAQVVRALAERLHAAGRVSDVDVLVESVLAREALGPTVLPNGVAMPHARSAAVTTTSVAVARLPEPVAFSTSDAPVRLVLLIAAVGDDPSGYLPLLQKIAAACVRTSFVTDLAEAGSAAELATLVARALA